MLEKVINVNSSAEMEDLGQEIGSKVRGGECIELKSDLGGGKTTFVRGFARGMGSFDAVSSPTFTIAKQYKSKNLTCYHFDFYRLSNAGVVAEELKEYQADPNGVILIEWGDTVTDALPKERLIVEISRLPDNEQSRMCRITYSIADQYMVEGL